ncbi:hypothetical protein PLICRDRAFT_38122, partial [Plicaturopsis crispa FD-325 SS-3]
RGFRDSSKHRHVLGPLASGIQTGLGIYTEGPPLGRRAQPEIWVQVSFTGPESRHNNESWLGRGPCTQGPPQ